MKSKLLKKVITTIIFLVALIVIDKVLIANHVYKFFGSIIMGMLIGGIISFAIFFVCNIFQDLKESEDFSKKIKRIKSISIVTVMILSCIISFLWMGDFVKKVSDDDEECFCNKPAIYRSNQSSTGYCEEHKNYLLEYMKSLNTRDKGSSGGSGGDYYNDNYYDDYDYDNDGNINQGEWEDALGDYMDDIMGN